MFAKLTFIRTVCGVFTQRMFILTFCGMFTKITLIPTFCDLELATIKARMKRANMRANQDLKNTRDFGEHATEGGIFVVLTNIQKKVGISVILTNMQQKVGISVISANMQQ